MTPYESEVTESLRVIALSLRVIAVAATMTAAAVAMRLLILRG